MALLAYLLQNQKTKVKICYYIFLYHLYIFCTNDNALKIKKNSLQNSYSEFWLLWVDALFCRLSIRETACYALYYFHFQNILIFFTVLYRNFYRNFNCCKISSTTCYNSDSNRIIEDVSHVLYVSIKLLIIMPVELNKTPSFAFTSVRFLLLYL